MSPRILSSRLVRLLAALFLVAACVFVILYFRASSANQQQLEIEAAKSMLQIMAVALVGNVVLMLVRDHEERRKTWTARRDLLRTDLSERLGDLYAKSKQARRLLRASTDPSGGSLDAARYSELLEEVSEIQLKIEGLQRAAAAGVRRRIIPEAVPNHLRSMEHYLGTLVTEYESSAQDGKQSIVVAQRSNLQDFTAKSGSGTFRSQFVEPYHEATRAIEGVIEADLG